MFGFVSVKLFNPSAFRELSGQSYQGGKRGRFPNVQRSLTLKDFPRRRQTADDWISNDYACILNVMLFAY